MASAVRLSEHPDFAAFLTAAAADSGLPETFVEKDYWITEILRTIATTLGGRAIFKGGTSLSKGWNLLDRFSEDIDLFVDPAAEPSLGSKRAIDRTMKKLNGDVSAIAGLECVRAESRTIGGHGRIDTFRYDSHFPPLEGFPTTVRLEPGIQSGKQPTARVKISSIVGELLIARGVADELDVEGIEPFEMDLLHFRRTFVEKLFAIHGKVERLEQEGVPLGRDVRHYADLYVLAGLPEVIAMLESEEYEAIRLDYDEKSRTYFPNSYRPPPDLRFTSSIALFPPDELRARIEPGYEEECRHLFFRPHPGFGEVRQRFAEIRDLL
ncbi:MAG TPA: nucleotidyl transferase AbiEii/AbiGii toxin family protein [Solirubrobacterales bacterium]|nr:nucleotidyl transferase AbiEii/AbiGii toxin family protein [Solirubrobacterales bacterium]